MADEHTPQHNVSTEGSSSASEPLDDLEELIDTSVKEALHNTADEEALDTLETEVQARNKTPSGVAPTTITPDTTPKPPTAPEQHADSIADTSEEKLSLEELGQRLGPKPVEHRDSIRTFHDDVAHTIRDQHLSMTKIAIAENERRLKQRKKESEQSTDEKPRVLRRILIVLVVLTVLGGGGFVGWRMYTERSAPLMVSGTPYVPILPADHTQFLDITEQARDDLLNRIEGLTQSTDITLGEVFDIVPIEAIDERSDFASITTILERLQVQAADRLFRALGERYMLGAHAFDKRQPFLIISVDTFETAFVEMLAWEPQLRADLPFLIRDITVRLTQDTTPVVQPTTPLNPPEETSPAPSLGTSTTSGAPSTDKSATSTATTTDEKPTPVVTPPPARWTFVDRIIKNRDARVLLDEYGDIRMVYSFPREDLLVITSNENTLIEILSRLTNIQLRQ